MESLATNVFAFYDNASGCNSREEVEQACLLNPTIDIDELAAVITLYPNPVSDILTLELDNTIRAANVGIKIYSNIGAVVPFESQIIDTYKLSVKLKAFIPSGVYFIKVTDGQSQLIAKFTFKT